jgi:hypothetical protein
VGGHRRLGDENARCRTDADRRLISGYAWRDRKCPPAARARKANNDLDAPLRLALQSEVCGKPGRHRSLYSKLPICYLSRLPSREKSILLTDFVHFMVHSTRLTSGCYCLGPQTPSRISPAIMRLGARRPVRPAPATAAGVEWPFRLRPRYHKGPALRSFQRPPGLTPRGQHERAHREDDGGHRSTVSRWSSPVDAFFGISHRKSCRRIMVRMRSVACGMLHARNMVS